MKVIHTSDWHLGKKLYKKDRLPEQKLFLDWLMLELEKQQAHVLVISGDIFDTPMPPTEALSLFFNFLKSLESISFLNHKPLEKVVIIGGNHDSAKLLEAPRPFLNDDLITIQGRPKPPASLTPADLKVWRKNNSVSLGNKAFIGLLPYFRVSDFVDSPFKELIEGYADMNPQEQITAQIDTWSQNLLRDKEDKTAGILLGHHLFGSFMPGGSEQGVSLSGLDTIPLSLFRNWDVLMLGHIHKAQVLKKENPLAIYCGSPLPMRFSESNEKKIYSYIIDTKGDTKLEYQAITIPVFRPLIKINSAPDEWMAELLKAIKEWGPNENPLKAYLEISLMFSDVQPNYIDHVRDKIKDLPVELLNFFSFYEEEEDQETGLNAQEVRSSTIEELFDFYLTQRGVPDQERGDLAQTFKQVLRGTTQDGHHED